MSISTVISPAIEFAHPSEAEIARLLDFYGVLWEYEPRSFALEWNDEGRPIRSFTPDFYLIDYDLFLEVTTVKPSLSHRKHRKIRRMRELYPEVKIKLLSLRDIEALMLKYGRVQKKEDGAEVETVKDPGFTESAADCSVNSPAISASTVVPTDLATHQDRPKTETA